jgi:hypothetical protein
MLRSLYSRKTTKPSGLDQFLERSRKVHNHKYNYDNVDYINSTTKVEIICPEHGSFNQLPKNHCQGNGCPTCGYEKLAREFSMNIQQVKDKFCNRHGNKYDYSKAEYVNAKTKVEIICPEHGSFWQTPESHWRGSGCSSCACYGFDSKAKAILYYMKDTVTGLYKIGITNNSLKVRFGQLFSRFKVLDTKEFQLGIDAEIAERKILEEFQEFRAENEDFKSSGGKGFTEFFNKDILNLDKEKEDR